MTEQLVRTEIKGPVAVVTMDNPATLNAMDQDLGPRLAANLERVWQRKAVKAVVLTGAGGNFCAGGNLQRAQKHLAENPDSGGAVVFAQYTQWVHRVVVALCQMPKPVISAVEGGCSGAGLAWLLASDFAVLAQSAKVVSGFVAVGLVPAGGVTLHLPRLLGAKRAAEILMGNELIPPQKCLELGLCDQLAPAGRALDQALELARRLARSPRAALAATKRLINLAGRHGLHPQQEDERREVLKAADTPEFRRRVEAFARKA